FARAIIAGEQNEPEYDDEYEEPQQEAVEQDSDEYRSPEAKGDYFFAEHFDDIDAFNKRWIRSEAKKDDADEQIAKYDGTWAVEPPLKDGMKGDSGLVLKNKAKHSAISALLDKPFYFKDRPLVVQYEECGGAYMKLISLDSTKKKDQDLKNFRDKTPYTIMFGPDKCGNDHKLHFIFRHKNPLNGSFEEKHGKKPKERVEETFKDKRPHLYTLVVNPDNTFQISVDHKVVNKGSLLEDFHPPVNPLAEIDDPEDFRPADWDEREKIPDPEARKPEDWDEDAPAQTPDEEATKPAGWLDDEPENIPDPNAEKPEDWDEEMDGEWEAPLVPNPLCEGAPGCGEWTRPMIDNPAYRGKWRPPLIDNPNYKGKWHPRRIPNPDFFEDLEPFHMTPIGALGFELWSMSDHILFDNLLVTDSLLQAEEWAADSFDIKRIKLDKQAESLVTRLMAYTTEHPWLWAVYVMVIGLPIVAFFIFCCGGPTRRPDDDAASRKKTDAVSSDDPTPEKTPTPSSKSQLDAPQDAQEGEEEEEEDEEEEGEGEEDEGEEAAAVEEPAADDSTFDAPNKSPRRRKPRKE
ncbi:hypothetical protein B566_EDAN002729, partial [Ephemera danica]